MKKTDKATKKTLFIVILALVGLITISPWVISSPLGTRLLTSFMSSKASGSVALESLTLRWFGPQKIVGASFISRDESLHVTCQDLEIQASLFALLTRPHSLPHVRITRPTCTLDQQKRQASSPPLVISSSSLFPSSPTLLSSPFPPQKLLAFSGQWELIDGSLQVISPTGVPTVVNHLHAKCSLHQGEATLYVTGESASAANQGSISLEAKRSSKGDLSLDVSCSYLPLEGIDALCFFSIPKYQGTLVALVGPSLSLQCHIAMTESQYEGNILIDAKELHAFVAFASQGDAISLRSPAKIQMQIPSALLERLISWAPSQSLSCALQIDALSIPLLPEGPSLQNTSLQGIITSLPNALQQDLTFAIDTSFSCKDLSQELLLQSQIHLQKGKEHQDLSLQGSFHDLFSKEPRGSASLQVKNMPTSFLDTLYPGISSYLGQNLSCLLSFEGSTQKAALTLAATTPKLDLPSLTLSLENKNWLLQQESALCKYTIDPPLLALLTKGYAHLQEPKTLSLQIRRLLLSPSDLAFMGEVSLPAVTVGRCPLPNMQVQIAIESLRHMSLALQGEDLTLTSTWSYSPDKDLFALITPLELTYTIRNLILPSLQIVQAPLHITLAPLQLPHNKAGWSTLQATAKIYSAEISCVPQGKELLILQDTYVNLDFVGTKGVASCSLDSKISPTGTLSAVCQLKNLLGPVESMSLTGTFQAKAFPLAIFGDPRTSVLLGDTLDVTMRAMGTGQQCTFALQGKTPLLTFQGDALLTPEGLILAPKSVCTWTYVLTPQGYCLLSPARSLFSLVEPAVLEGSILSCTIPRELEHISGQGTIHCGLLRIQHKEAPAPLSLDHILVSMKRQTAQSPWLFSLDASGGGSLHLESSLAPANYEMALQVKEFSSLFLDAIIPVHREFFSTLLGPTFSMTGELHIGKRGGPFTLQLDSPVTRLRCQGRVDQGILTLQEKATLEMAISPKVGRFLLQGANPLSITSFSTLAPLAIEIPSQGFSVSLTPFSWQQTTIPFLRIDLGKVRCQNEGSLHLALQFLKSKQAQSKELQLWFAPIDLSMKKGIVQVERSEILLADSYDLALWGEVDFPGNYASMILGITAEALQKGLGIKNLPKDYVLKIPLKGPLDHIELNSTTATSKIAALMLWQSGALEKGLGPLGGVLKQVVPPPGGEGKTPPPKTPFPWQKKS